MSCRMTVKIHAMIMEVVTNRKGLNSTHFSNQVTETVSGPAITRRTHQYGKILKNFIGVPVFNVACCLCVCISQYISIVWGYIP